MSNRTEIDYKGRNFLPFKKSTYDMCGNCKAFYKQLYEEGVTSSPFPPDCEGHIINKINYINESDFSSTAEYENAIHLMDPVVWAKLEFDWDPRWYQEHMISCTSKKKLYRCGRRLGKCLIQGTQVLTPTGPRAIESLRTGDLVYDEYGKEIKVLEVFDQGLQDVVDLSNNGKLMATCTKQHPWLTKHNRLEGAAVRKTDDLYKGVKICRTEVNAPLGLISEPLSYVIGVLLGDGSCRENGLIISSADESIVKKVAMLLSTTYKKTSADNYHWYLPQSNKKQIPHYEAWLHNKYAHEKLVDINVVKCWDRDTLLSFVAGCIDTDGSVQFKNNEISIRVDMQALPVIEALKYAFLALWQVDLTIGVDNRAKYKNGPVYYLLLKHIYHCKRVLKELDNHLQCSRKKYKALYDQLEPNNFEPTSVGVTISNPRKEHCFDIHVDSTTNLYLLANGLVTHNTEGLVVETLYEMFTREAIDVLMIAPYERQVTRFFDEINKFIGKSINLKGSIARYIKSPSRMELNNGSKILGFSSAATGSSRSDKIRGQDASLIVIDEMDYLLDEDINAILAILASRKDCKLIAASTPAGWRRKFYQFCSDKNIGFKEFWFLSSESPEWTDKLEDFFAATSGGKESANFIHEYLADFAEATEGVFKAAHINAALEPYVMETFNPEADTSYILGVDWNKSAGTHMCILGCKNGLLRLVRKIIIPEQEYTQTAAVEKIIALHNVWRFKHIYVDAGYGAAQIEMLRKHARVDRNSKLDTILTGIHMNQHIELSDPLTGETITKPAKPFIVQQTAKLLEDGRLIIPASEDTAVSGSIVQMGLVQQMRNYIVEGYSTYGLPRYSQGQDHTLTAFMLACGGFIISNGDFRNVPYSRRVGGVSMTSRPISVNDPVDPNNAKSISEYDQNVKQGLTLKSTTKPNQYKQKSSEFLTRDLDSNKKYFKHQTLRHYIREKQSKANWNRDLNKYRKNI